MKILTLLAALRETWGRVAREGFPPAILEKALRQNPWFTPAAIQLATRNMRDWYTNENIAQLIAHYNHHIQLTPYNYKHPLKIGIIAAGNVPLVGWHDVLMVAVSGHMGVVKCSHQDSILIPYIVAEWKRMCPELRDKIIFADTMPKEIDALIATGSNLTALHLGEIYGHLPLLLRKSRFSVAIWHAGCGEREARRLSSDIFLFNGLGCRNVSNILYDTQADISLLKKILAEYPISSLSPLYAEALHFQKARKRLLLEECEDIGTILIVEKDRPMGSPVGVLNFIPLATGYKEVWERYAADIQCVVGEQVDYGLAQCPEILDFADNIDTLEWLAQLGV